MTTYLFPRIRRVAVDQMLERLHTKQHTGSAFALAFSLPDAVQYASTGGTKVAPGVLNNIRKSIVEIATETGFPKRSDRASFAAFDSAVSIWLSTCEYTQSGEFLRDDIWACMSTVFLPDVVAWRFSWSARERFHGGIRNAFQRLWLRGQLLDRGTAHPDRWELLEKLTEDALVQITERPSIACSKILSKELAESWLRTSRKYGTSKMEDLMRKATLTLRLQNEIRNLANLPQAELARIIDTTFDSAAKSSGLKN